MTKVKSFFDQRKGKLTVPAVLLLMCAVFAIMNPRFLSVDNILSVLRQISMLCIMACGVTFVMISGGLDLSVGYLELADFNHTFRIMETAALRVKDPAAIVVFA